MQRNIAPPSIVREPTERRTRERIVVGVLERKSAGDERPRIEVTSSLVRRAHVSNARR
jgi:hypothetical protein